MCVVYIYIKAGDLYGGNSISTKGDFSIRIPVVAIWPPCSFVVAAFFTDFLPKSDRKLHGSSFHHKKPLECSISIRQLISTKIENTDRIFRPLLSITLNKITHLVYIYIYAYKNTQDINHPKGNNMYMTCIYKEKSY